MHTSFSKILFILTMLIIILFLVLQAKVRENIGFSDDNFIRTITISYKSFLKCSINVLLSDSDTESSLFGISCSTNYYFSIMTILLLLSYFLSEALRYSYFLCKPFMFVILRLVITVILIISLPEIISKYIVLEFILEFRLVSLFYSMLLIPLRFILLETLSIFGLALVQNSDLVLI